MSSIPWLETLEELSGFEFFGVIVLAFLVVFSMGFIIDLLMGQTGFGAFLNGALVALGCVAGIYLRYRLLDPYRADDVFVTIGFALGATFVLLFVLALVKSRLA